MGSLSLRLWPEYLHPASELHRFRWPSEGYSFFASMCRANGRELDFIEIRHLQYLPYHRVSLYVRHGMIARVVVSGELIEVNNEIKTEWFKQGNRRQCPVYLQEQIPHVGKSGDAVGGEVWKSEFNWMNQPRDTGTGIVMGAGLSESAIRRAMRMELAPGSHTKQEWRQVMQRDGWKCLRCGKTKRLSKDHVMPIAKGGSNDASNLQTLCLSCNSWKGAKHIDFRSSLMAGY